MHDETNDLRAFDVMERDVLYLLTDPDDNEPIWSVEDIGREIESTEPMTPVRGLLRGGLMHRTSDGFVFATRAGVRAAQLVDRAI